MQLVEQGKLSLDDADLTEKICPELKDVKIIKKDESGKITLVEKKNRITLRMLLSHTGMYFSEFLLSTIKEAVALQRTGSDVVFSGIWLRLFQSGTQIMVYAGRPRRVLGTIWRYSHFTSPF